MLRSESKSGVQVEGIDAGIDFLDLPLRRRGVTLFDDARDLAPGPDDAPVAVRPVDGGGETVAAALAARWVSSSEPSVAPDRNGTSPDSRTTVPDLPARQRLGLQQRMAGSQLRFLDDRDNVWVMT